MLSCPPVLVPPLQFFYEKRKNKMHEEKDEEKWRAKHMEGKANLQNQRAKES